ncbi:hypothetical protein CK203_082521 [Vitis vinifera]|uniref:Uncharacterized protein n=1 Tax=Vitis vinifera TaxID=29760 RepID=A0A438DJY5_VITVI|nr:hypothetical protein CK203_082521 [Vitis vinifera]
MQSCLSTELWADPGKDWGAGGKIGHLIYCRWLLGYPVVYLFSTEHISDAIFNLSTKSLRIFKILICRFVVPESCLMSVRLIPEAKRSVMFNMMFKTCVLFAVFELGNADTNGLLISESSNFFRNDAYKGSGKEELLSFSVPYDLSMGGSNEPWAKAFMAHLEAKWEKCKQVWSSLQMEVSEYPPQAIAL